MKTFYKILKPAGALFMLLTFFVSTTGFTFYEHVCSHHQQEKEVVLVKSNCCNEEFVAVKQSSHSCCEEQRSKTSCHTENENSSCCEFDINYFRLTEQFVDPQPLTRNVVASEAELDCFGLDPEEAVEVMEVSKDTDLYSQKPKQPKYRLYQQVKIAPPLI